MAEISEQDRALVRRIMGPTLKATGRTVKAALGPKGPTAAVEGFRAFIREAVKNQSRRGGHDSDVGYHGRQYGEAGLF